MCAGVEGEYNTLSNATVEVGLGVGGVPACVVSVEGFTASVAEAVIGVCGSGIGTEVPAGFAGVPFDAV